jgi:hypothetical protein
VTLRVDPGRASAHEAIDGRSTGIIVRALHPREGWGAYDIITLDDESLAAWLQGGPGRAAQVVLRLLDLLR